MTTQQIFFCSQCGELEPNETRVEARQQTFTVRGESVSVEAEVRLCGECGEAVNDSILDTAMMTAIYDAYRARHNLMYPAQIVELRKRLGLSQKNLALLLGLGEVTVHRYENGALADAAQNNLLVLMQEPANVQKLLDRNNSLSPSAKANLQKRLDTLLPAASMVGPRTGRSVSAKRPEVKVAKVATHVS